MSSEMETKTLKKNEIIEKLKECCGALSHIKQSDGALRRNILKEISEIPPTSIEEINQNDFFEHVIKPLLPYLSDPSEKCRELTCRTLISVVKRISVVGSSWLTILHVLESRLGKSDDRETSEEVRLLEIAVLRNLIEKYDGDLLPYFTDISNILSQSITDSYPEVKRQSCECASLLAERQRKNFHMISNILLKALLQTLSHQHLKTRAICIRSIGSVFRHGSSQDFELAFNHIAQRTFDHSPLVRVAVMEVTAEWLLHFKDRYSYFHHLVPLMLSTLFDKVPDIKNKAEILWNEVGNQYLTENAKDYKDLIDFPRPEPENYPYPGLRPSTGCRILVRRNLFNILPPLLNDLRDWGPETRIKSCKVLYALVVHAEDGATAVLATLLQGIATAARDEEREVADYALRSSELLGFFVEPSLLCDGLLALIDKNPSSTHLGLLAATLRGHGRKLPEECFRQICTLLSDPRIAALRQDVEQANLLLCIDALISSRNKMDSLSSFQFFSILSTICGLTVDSSILNKGMDLLEKLSEVQDCTLGTLFQQHVLPLLKRLMANNELWTMQSPEFFVFNFLIQTDYIDKVTIDTILPAITANLDTAKDAKLRSTLLATLTNIFKKLDSHEIVSDRVSDLVRYGILPNVAWTPGKTANALRTVAIATLFEIIGKNFITDSMWESIGEELLSLLSTLSDDNEKSNRLLACRILEAGMPKFRQCVGDHKLHIACYEFLQCLDDESDDVRIMTGRVLTAYLKSFPKEYNWNAYRSYLDKMLQSMLIHLDDGNERVRHSVLELVKQASSVAPDLLVKQLKSKKYEMASADLCEDLMKHLHELNV